MILKIKADKEWGVKGYVYKLTHITTDAKNKRGSKWAKTIYYVFVSKI